MAENRSEETFNLAFLTDFFLDEDWEHIQRWHPEISRKLKQLWINGNSAEKEQATLAEQVSALKNDIKNLCFIITDLEREFARVKQKNK